MQSEKNPFNVLVGKMIVTKEGKTHSFPLKKRDEIGQLINSMY